MRDLPQGCVSYDTELRSPVEVDLRFPVAIGEGVAQTSLIAPGKAQQLVKCFKQIRLQLALRRVTAYRAVATAAFRKSNNGANVAEQIFSQTGIHIETISGQEEATLSMLSLLAQGKNVQTPLLLADVGGLSTDLSLYRGKGSELVGWSFDVGTLRTPETPRYSAALSDYTHRLALLGSRYPQLKLVATGGSIHHLGKLWGSNKSLLTLQACIDCISELTPLSLEQRCLRYHLSPLRSQTMTRGALIYRLLMEQTRKTRVIAPVIGIRHGICCSLAGFTL